MKPRRRHTGPPRRDDIILAVEVPLPDGETILVELPPGYRRGMSFREFVALSGGLEPDDPPEDWAAWFADARA